MKINFFVILLSVLCISGNCVAQAKDKITDLDTTLREFAKVEKESEFPGGVEKWHQYLSNNLRYPGKARRKKIQGTVVVQFIVNKDGSVSDYEAVSGPEELREAAVEVIKNSPKWIPAQQSGKNVRSYKKQPIGFKL